MTNRAIPNAGLFPALLKHWRARRGLSQLDLALAAEVSARHVSFLETGRAKPSRDMALRLGATLDVPLRDQNALLRAAGFDAEFGDADRGALPDLIRATLEQMKAKHEPFPLAIMSRTYDLIDANAGAFALLAHILPAPPDPATFNLLDAMFDPAQLKPFILNWDQTARLTLDRLHREALGELDDGSVSALLGRLLALPDIPKEWRQPDLSEPAQPCFTLRLAAGDEVLSFLTTLTAFSAPQNVLVQELRIEAYYPLDEVTRAACERFATPR
ncbi:MAG: helix-turn-helix transcriptional regulator [bacterium]